MPIEMVFLNAVQALETYHSRFVGDDLTDYKVRAEALIKRSNETHRIHFLSVTQMDPNLKYIILKSRLCELFINDFEFVIHDFRNSKAFPYELIDAIVDTRHYFTHYGKSKEEKVLTGFDLVLAIRTCRIALEYHILKELGFDVEYRRNVIGKRQLNIRYTKELRFAKAK